MTMGFAGRGEAQRGPGAGCERTGDKGKARRARSPLGRMAPVLLALAMAGAAAGASAAPGNPGGPATEAIRETISQVIRVLEDPTLKSPGKAGERRRLLEQAVAERFSYTEMAKRSLGAHWLRFTEPEREEFVALFQRLLSHTYAHTIEGYSGEQVQYLDERGTEEFAEVRTKIVSDKTETPVDYRLLRMRGEWRVYDVVVDGVSLVSNYRSQFTRILRSSSPAELMAQLRKMVEADHRLDRSSSLRRLGISA